MTSKLPLAAGLAAAALLAASAASAAGEAPDAWLAAGAKVEAEMAPRLSPADASRLSRGIRQVRPLWRAEDGSPEQFAAFVKGQFVSDPAVLDEMFARYLALLESIDGRMNEIRRDLRAQLELEQGEIRPFDELWGNLSPAAHLSEDYFRTKVGFAALLNFPLTSLDERLKDGPSWSRRQWAEARLAGRFGRRVPSDAVQAVDEAYVKADAYIADLNFRMHHLLTPSGERLFPAGLRLLSHWNLRDQIKADYAEGKAGLAKQRMIQLLMEKIVLQEVPKVVIDNPLVDWTPATGALAAAPAGTEKVPDRAYRPQPGTPIPAAREDDERYERILAIWRAQRLVDPHSPKSPTHIDRRFQDDREIPEAEVRRLFESILGSPAVPRLAKLVSQRLGRPLEPFDIWYAGFKPRGKYTEAELDRIVRAKYPTVAAFQADLPSILGKLGFDAPTAKFLSDRIVVDPARGSGHALGSERRGDSAHLRTRVPAGGMDYKGYNIAIHELGHNVEQVFSLDRIDHWTLKGVPNTAFTEALAFVFQARDLELLGLEAPSEEQKRLAVLNDFWATFEIAGVALVDMEVWRWMYEHEGATAAQLREATVEISKKVWNKWYAPVFGKKDVVLLGIYSHMVHSGLYLPDYPLGHLIAFQVESAFEGKVLGPEFERVARIGALVPDLWMKQATGAPLSAKPLEAAALAALDAKPAKGR